MKIPKRKKIYAEAQYFNGTGPAARKTQVLAMHSRMLVGPSRSIEMSFRDVDSADSVTISFSHADALRYAFRIMRGCVREKLWNLNPRHKRGMSHAEAMAFLAKKLEGAHSLLDGDEPCA